MVWVAGGGGTVRALVDAGLAESEAVRGLAAQRVHRARVRLLAVARALLLARARPRETRRACLSE